MLIKEFRHIGIAVKDLEDATEFFELFGYYVIEKGNLSKRDAKKITGKDTKIEYVKMQSYYIDTNPVVIELIKYTPDIDIKFHIAVSVDNIEHFLDEQIYYTDKKGRKVRYVNYGGLTLEVVQE